MLIRERRADRIGNIARVQRRGGDLLEQRLKQVVVAPIDQGHGDGRVGELARGRQAAEATPDDHDVRSALHGR